MTKIHNCNFGLQSKQAKVYKRDNVQHNTINWGRVSGALGTRVGVVGEHTGETSAAGPNGVG